MKSVHFPDKIVACFYKVIAIAQLSLHGRNFI